MANETDASNRSEGRPEAEHSHNLSRMARDLEDSLFDNLRSLNEKSPDPLAPIAEHVAHTLAWGRVRADAEEIAAIHERDADERRAS